MSFELASGDKLLGQFASNKGLADLKAAVTPEYPALCQFLNNGQTTNVQAVLQDLAALAWKAKPDVASTANGMIRMMRGKQNIKIVH